MYSSIKISQTRETISTTQVILNIITSAANYSILRDFDDLQVYYTGICSYPTGNWITSDGEITLKDVLGAIKKEKGFGKLRVHIRSDASYSGQWVY